MARHYRPRTRSATACAGRSSRVFRPLVRFVSYEPAIAPLGPVDIDKADCLPDWIMSGTGARRMKPAWVRAVRDQCADLGIAFFMKQIGSNHDGWPTGIRGKGDDMDAWPKDLRIRQFPSRKKHY
jgi:protein gp37